MDRSQVWIMEESSYQIRKGAAVVLLFSRNLEDPFITTTHEFHGFRPYFFAPANERPPLPDGCEYAEETQLDAYNREVRKVYTDLPSTVRKLKSLFTFTDMADFLFEKRFTADYGITYAYKLEAGKPVHVEIEEVLPPRIIYSDIEVLAPTGKMPLPMGANWPVVSIQTKDSYTGEIFIFTASNLEIEGEKILFPQTDAEDHIACKDEQELFAVFQKYLKDINPDILTFWNGDRYDYPYLIRRARNLEISCAGLARLGNPTCEYDADSEDLFNTRVVGRTTLDMLKAFKVLTKQKAQRESYDLKSVSADYGFEYIDYGAKLLELLKKKDYTTFLQYCRNDVIAMHTIDNHPKVNLFKFYETYRKLAGCKLNNTLHNSVIIESAFIKYGMGPMPTKAPFVKDGKKFQGALVLLPPAGVHEWVGTVDLAALYPTVMRAFPDKCCPDPNYKTIEILEIFVNERERYRAINKTDQATELTKLIEFLFKVLANSVYGALGLKSFRLYKEECAKNVTGIGRDVDRFVHKCLKEYGYNVIYSDTDSSFFSPVMTPEEGLQIQDRLNIDLQKWGEQQGAKVIFTLKFEKLYRRILFKKDENAKKKDRFGDDVGAKKKYVGHIIWKEGKDLSNEEQLNYMGLELVRSDTSIETRRILRKFFELVLIKGSIPEATKFIRKSYKDVKSGKIPVFDLSIPKQIRAASRAESPHKRGIDNTHKVFNYNIPDGVKPRLIYVKDYPYEFCIDDELDLGEWYQKIDWDKHLEKNVTKKLRLYAESSGISWDNVIYGQQGIEQWF